MTWQYAVGFTVLPHIGGFAGGVITRREVPTWYASLNKPSWRPPNKAFPVVWTTLYTGMGYLTVLPSAVPFLSPSRLSYRVVAAFVELLFLYGAAAATTVSYYSVNRTASLLMVPYLAWLSLAASLNYRIWKDNPDADSKKN
ncbi:translocator protein-like [Protopterus annectens]|uniref:translocator protein-like n=1 Tax=Protopterus annectens TaxID=7888 RepID=UPI001CFB1BF3|nr:translocator protein-like [Protopterus annectens]